MIKNAKTNNKASHNGGLFIDNKKGNTMTSENPLLALRDKISTLDENYWPCWLSDVDWP